MSTFRLIQGDARKIPLSDSSVDLVVTSPPYMDARTYGIDVKMKPQAWVDCMLEVVRECLRVCRGPVNINCAGVTRDRNYWPGPEGLAWEAHKLGIHQYRPCIFYRHGIPGSGGDDWYRADTEYVLCFKHPGKLPYANPKANGHPPKYGPGGVMSHRVKNGTRVNQWGPIAANNGRRANGKHKPISSPSHRVITVNQNNRQADGARSEGDEPQLYIPPAIANPGNVIKLKVGGGHMGHLSASLNEAPFPVKLPAFFIRSHCPPGGIVLDPFCGSSSTGQAALELGRNYIWMDIRESQLEISRRRLGEFGTEYTN